MHLFFVTINLPEEKQSFILQLLQQSTQIYSQLDPATLWHHSSDCQSLFLASIQTEKTATQPKEYISHCPSGHLLYSGLPLDRNGGFSAHKAPTLAKHWDEIVPELEGQYVILRSQNNPAQLDLRTDFIGMEPVYYYQKDGMWLLSNHVRLIEEVMGGSQFDPLGVSLFLNIGWPGSDRTLRQGIKVIPAGQHWTWQKGSPVKKHSYYPASKLTNLRPFQINQPNIQQLCSQMLQMCHQFGSQFPSVESPLTAGKDSRLLAAICLKLGLPIEFYTDGAPNSDDVIIGSAIAQKYQQKHIINTITETCLHDSWHEASWRLICQNDGMSHLSHLSNIINHPSTIERLRKTFWGIGGEIGRGFYGSPEYYLKNLNVTDVISSMQERIMFHESALLTTKSTALASEFLSNFTVEHMDLGFAAHDIFDLFYLYQRVGRWGGLNAKRVRMIADVYSPFCSRAFVEASFGLPAKQRYIEPLHYNMLQQLNSTLHKMPFGQGQWRNQNPNINLAQLYKQQKYKDFRLSASRTASKILKHRKKTRKKTNQPTILSNLFQLVREDIRQVCLDQSQSSLWEFINRERFEKMMQNDATSLTHHQLKVVYTIGTLFYYNLSLTQVKQLG